MPEVAADVEGHDGMPTPVDSEGHKQLVVAFRSGFSDWAERIDDVIGEGEEVVIRVTGSGTHDGEFQGIAPTGRRVTATGIGIGRIEGGRIVEAWAAYDALGLMQQLGAVPRSTTALVGGHDQVGSRSNDGIGTVRSLRT